MGQAEFIPLGVLGRVAVHRDEAAQQPFGPGPGDLGRAVLGVGGEVDEVAAVAVEVVEVGGGEAVDVERALARVEPDVLLARPEPGVGRGQPPDLPVGHQVGERAGERRHRQRRPVEHGRPGAHGRGADPLRVHTHGGHAGAGRALREVQQQPAAVVQRRVDAAEAEPVAPEAGRQPGRGVRPADDEVAEQGVPAGRVGEVDG
ncbi:hypothetical protein [Streptomyces sp. S063]|uniref:hypothetical protein n=1 Tax=Streptomyces sp. S063 TaxID=2005885 RepID=UPI0010082ACE|nr:hypothetical protein [Streptomyces sp. S063]